MENQRTKNKWCSPSPPPPKKIYMFWGHLFKSILSFITTKMCGYGLFNLIFSNGKFRTQKQLHEEKNPMDSAQAR